MEFFAAARIYRSSMYVGDRGGGGACTGSRGACRWQPQRAGASPVIVDRARTYVEGIMRGEDAHGAVSYAERSRLGRLFRVVCSAACWCVRPVSFSLRYMLLGTLLQQETFAH